jgi:hypothetical protein
MANVPLSGETGEILPVIWGNDQSRDLRRINTTGKSVELEKFVSTEQQMLHVNDRSGLSPLSSRHNQTQVGTKKATDISATFRCSA